MPPPLQSKGIMDITGFVFAGFIIIYLLATKYIKPLRRFEEWFCSLGESESEDESND